MTFSGKPNENLPKIRKIHLRLQYSPVPFIQCPFNFQDFDVSLFSDLAAGRSRKDVAFIGEPINQQNDNESWNNVSCDFIRRLNSNHNQTNATNNAYNGKRFVPETHISWPHLRPRSTMGKNTGDGWHHIGNIKKNNAHSSNCNIRHEQCESDSQNGG